MKYFRKMIVVSTLAVALGGSAFAQEHHDEAKHDDAGHGEHNNGGGQHFVQHKEWKKGARMKPADWNRGVHVDYARYHLAGPPPGYEWRQVDGNFVMAAVATGVIATVVAASLSQ